MKTRKIVGTNFPWGYDCDPVMRFQPLLGVFIGKQNPEHTRLSEGDHSQRHLTADKQACSKAGSQ